MKTIVVKSKWEAENAVCDIPWVAISISSEPDNWPVLSEENRLGLLQLAFYDIDHPVKQYETFTEEQAQQILDFAAKYWDEAKVMLVHCEAGVSRSAAVAAALSKIYFGDDEKFFQSPYIPNSLVYRTILNKYYGKPILEPKPLAEPSDAEMEEWTNLF